MNPDHRLRAFFDHASFAAFPAGRSCAGDLARTRRGGSRRRRSVATLPRSRCPRATRSATLLKAAAPGLFRRLMRRFA